MSAVSPATQGHSGESGHGEGHPEVGFLKKYVFSIDHKVIGIQFLFMGLMFMVVGGMLAMLIRWQMAWPDSQTQGQKHPVPLLAKSLWATLDATAPLGSVWAVDSANKTVSVAPLASSSAADSTDKKGSLSPFDVRRGDTVSIVTKGGQAVTGEVRAIDDGSAIIAIPSGASVNVGDAVKGKRIPGAMPPDFYTMVFSMHGSIMIFFVVIPLLVGTFGNYLIPLKIGAPDMAFPILNGLVFWTALPAGAIMVASFFMPGGASQAGWTSYPPLSAIQLDPKPWDRSSWWAYEKPENSLEKIGEFLRIGDEVVKLEDVKFANGTLTAALPMGVSRALVEKTSSAATAAVNQYKKQTHAELKGVAAGAKSTGEEKGELTISGADEATARSLLALTQEKLTWQGTWSDASLIAGFMAMSAMFGFIGAYFIRFKSVIVNFVVGFVLSVGLGYFLNKGVQYAAFDGQSAWFLSITWLGFSSLMGAVNYLTTIIKLRCPGMTMFRLPLSVWSLFITSMLVLLATPVLASALLLNLLDHHRLTSFFLPLNWTRTNQIQTFMFGGTGSQVAGGGYPILHQHLFWFYSHPAVYIMIVPAMGMVSDIIAVFSRKPIFGYRPMVYAMAGIAFLGFIVWAHHMFQSGMNASLGTTFAISTMFIAVPSAIKTFNWLGTLWRGNIIYATPMLNALAFVAMFVIGGLSGIFMASTAIDVHIHDTYFIVAHIHYVLFGGSMFGIFAAIYFWYPKMFGRMMSEWLGKLHFWITFIGFNCTFFAMHILGMRGMPRRVAGYENYKSFADLQPMNIFITMSAFVMAVGQIPFVINFIGSMIWGKKAPSNPWNATTLEWADTPSPPPHGNFTKVPQVYHGPYEYSSPLVEEDWLAQTRYVEEADEKVAAAH
jgi:heme/copper-type cytochrome/quinol oxidase subunit 1